MQKLLFPIAMTAGVIVGPSASANHIDFLSDAGFSISANEADLSPSMNISTGAGENIIGSEREAALWADLGIYNAELNVPAGPGPVGSNTAVILNVFPTEPDAATSLGSLRLTYNGQGNTGLGGLDFDSLWDSLEVDFSSISGGQLDLRLSVSDTDGNTGTAALGALGSPGSYSFPFEHSEIRQCWCEFQLCRFNHFRLRDH